MNTTTFMALTKLYSEMSEKEKVIAGLKAIAEWALVSIPYLLTSLIVVAIILIIAAGKHNLKKGTKKIKFFEINKLFKAYGL